MNIKKKYMNIKEKKKKVIFNNSDFDLIDYDNIYDSLYIYEINYINYLEKMIYNKKKTLKININKYCPRSNLKCLGLHFQINNYYDINKTYKLTFNGRVLSNHNNLNFRFYDGQKWVTFENKINNKFNKFELNITMTEKFKCEQKLCIINNDLYIDNFKNNDNYIIEINDVQLVDLKKKIDVKKINIFNIYLYNLDYYDWYKNFDFLKKVYHDTYFKISLTEEIPNNESMGENDYLVLGDIRGSSKYNHFKKISSIFKKENIILFQFEHPYIYTHEWWIDTVFNDVGFSIGTFLWHNKKKENYIWTPIRSLAITEYDYKKHIINDLNYNKFIVANPFTHGGSNGKNYSVKLNTNNLLKLNRGKIIRKLLSKNLNIDLYGCKWVKETFPNYYKGEIGIGNGLDYGIVKINKLAEYKFIITIENLFIDGYITEKLSDILLCNRVPIYFGCPNIEIIMPNLFPNGAINGFSFKTFDDLILFINNMTDEEYLKRIEIIKNERDKIFKLFDLKNHISYFIARILDRKKLKVEYNEDIIELHNINNIVQK